MWQPGWDRIITAASTGDWAINRADCGDISLLFGSDGGSNILRATSEPGQIRCWLRYDSGVDLVRMNGQPIGDCSLAIIPAAQSFFLTTGDAYKWISLELSIDHLRTGSPPLFDRLSPLVFPFVLGLPRGAVKNVIDVATQIRRRKGEADLGSRVTQRLLDALAVTLAASDHFQPDSWRCDRPVQLNIADRAVNFIEAHDSDVVNVVDICRGIGASERTLLRVFRDFFDMGPARYMKLRRLNRVRSALRKRRSRSNSVRSVLLSYNITQFGRFAGEYRALFGESPSETRIKRDR